MNKSDCLKRAKELRAAGDVLKAVELCEAAPCSDVEDCQRYLGWFYFDQGDLEKSHSWYSRAALQGSAEALLDCWKVILRIDAKGDKQKAMDLCETLPCSEYLDCQRYLARAYFAQGDMGKTLHWCLKAAGHGGADDLAYVGILYRSRNEPALAMDFFKRAIAAGSIRANHLIGDLYANGLGVSKDVEMATRYYEKSAAGGLMMGEVRLLHLGRTQGGAFAILTFLARLPVLLAKALLIRFRNPKDARLIDMP